MIPKIANFSGFLFLILVFIFCDNSSNSQEYKENVLINHDTIYINDTVAYVLSHQKLVLNSKGLQSLRFIDSTLDVNFIDIANNEIESLSSLLKLNPLKYLDISNCNKIFDLSILDQILDDNSVLHCQNLVLSDDLSSKLLNKGVNINPDRRYIHIGHPREYDSSYQTVNPYVEDIKHYRYDMILLGGDILRNPTLSDERMRYVEKIFNIDCPTTIWSLGNHDYEELNMIPKYTNRSLFYSYSKNGIMFINLDTQDSFYSDTSNNILDEQFDMVSEICDTIENADCLIILTHKLIWMYDRAHMQDTLNNIVNTGAGKELRHTNDCNFQEDVYPLLLKVKQRGIHVLCIAGDIGYNVREYKYVDKNGIEFVGSGIGPGVKEVKPARPNSVMVISHNQKSGNVSWEYLPIGDIKDD